MVGILGGGAVLRHPEARHEEFLVAQHVEQRIAANDGAEQFRTLGKRGADQQSAVGAAADRQVCWVGVLMRDQPIGGGEEVVKDVLLVLEHARLVPLLAKFTTATQIRHCINAAHLCPVGRER